MSKEQLAKALSEYTNVPCTDDELIYGYLNAERSCFGLEEGIELAAKVETFEQWQDKIEEMNAAFDPSVGGY
jgi:hypothetical protein